MQVVDLPDRHLASYLVCLEDWSSEMDEAGDHKARWYENARDQGLRVKLALDAEDQPLGMIQYVPIELSPAQGEDLYMILCIWVHGHGEGIGDVQGAGIGTALLAAAEDDARALGAKGLAAWGLHLPVWMKASWFKKHGYRGVDRKGVRELVWKPFVADAVAPTWVEEQPVPVGTSGKVEVTAFLSGWCPAANLVYERARRAADELGSEVDFTTIDTSDRETFVRCGHSDEVFVNGRALQRGAPPSYKAVRRRMAQATTARPRLVEAFRRTGADLPGGDPLPSHGTEMEGWFWRATDAASGRVVVVLCGVNHHPAGDWATVAVALHPGGIVRSAALDDVRAGRTRFSLQAGTSADARLEATPDRLVVTLEDVHVDLRFTEPFVWPKALGGGGVFSAVPFLNQYWHPYRLGGVAAGVVEHGDDRWSIERSRLYCERNWGAGFPDRWWWGEAHDFEGEDASVAFSGGTLRLGRIEREVAGIVVRLGERVIRLTPPTRVRSAVSLERWSLSARSLRFRIDLEGDGAGLEPHVLPVPLPAERRNVDTDFEFLAGRLHCVVRERGRVVFDATSELAGLEIGSLPGRW